MAKFITDAITYLQQLSLSLSLSLHYLAPSPQLSVEYLTLSCPKKVSLNKRILKRVVLISKSCTYTKTT
jgi:hypothetical protein